MIKDVFMDDFMPPKIIADRGGGQAREGARRWALRGVTGNGQHGP
jgi:hypothetical protein